VYLRLDDGDKRQTGLLLIPGESASPYNRPMIPTITLQRVATGVFFGALIFTATGCVGYVEQPRYREARRS